MTQPNPRCYKMSASSIASFKACPTRFRLAYREGLRLDTDTEAQRVGTNWHGVHEVYRNAILDPFDDGHPAEGAFNTKEEYALDCVVRHLNKRYNTVPSWSDPIAPSAGWPSSKGTSLMTQPNPRCYKMSASSIASFKACPTRFRLAYREGLRLDTDTEAQRVGTNWHGVHEVYRNAILDPFDDGHPAEGAFNTKEEYALDCVVRHLNKRYNTVPSWSDPIAWDLERQILLTCFIGYLWYYDNDTMQYLKQEIAFDLGVQVPKVGLDLPTAEAVRVGKIDHLINWGGMVGVLERKSTTRDIDPSSQYWEKSQKDTQVSMYALAVRDLYENGDLPLEGVEFDRLGNTLYDVFRRPTTKPKKLTQKDTAEFINGEAYHGQQFEVKIHVGGSHKGVWVDGVPAEVEIGKKANVIRETVSMYAARLMDDITDRPAHYFQRKEVVRSQKELDKFRIELYNIYTAQKAYEKTGCWFENENQCRATFPCQFIPICYGAGADAVCDGKTTPPGFKRIFVDLTKDGQQVTEGD